jgi:hypothetical protein
VTSRIADVWGDITRRRIEALGPRSILRTGKGEGFPKPQKSERRSVGIADGASKHQVIDIKTSSSYVFGMRTTLTLDDDVAAALERLRKKNDASFKDVVNDVLRRGLREVNQPQKADKPFRIRTFNLGPSKIGSLDKISDVLALIEGENYK